jgi:hypothetical protein
MKSMSNVILTEKGNISDEDKQRLEAKGFIVVECKNPAQFQFIDEKQVIQSSNLLKAAIGAMAYIPNETTVKKFIQLLNASMADQP